MLRQAGGQADQLLVQATDDDRHGVTSYARTAVTACLRGASTEEIVRKVLQQVEKRLAAKAASRRAAAEDRGHHRLAVECVRDRQRDDRAVGRSLTPDPRALTSPRSRPHQGLLHRRLADTAKACRIEGLPPPGISAGDSIDATSRPAVSRHRSGADRRSARSRSAGTRSPISSASCSAGCYARAADPQRALWGGPAPLTRRRLRRFRAVGDARHHPRRPARLRAVLQPGAFPRAPARDPAALAGRHVVPRRLRSAACSRSSCSRASAASRSCRSATSPAPSAPIGLFLGRIANFINGELWGRADRRALGDGVSAAAGRCRAIRASSTRRRSKASCCSSCSGSLHARRRAEAARV